MFIQNTCDTRKIHVAAFLFISIATYFNILMSSDLFFYVFYSHVMINPERINTMFQNKKNPNWVIQLKVVSRLYFVILEPNVYTFRPFKWFIFIPQSAEMRICMTRFANV
jgi:hypothetical protein